MFMDYIWAPNRTYAVDAKQQILPAEVAHEHVLGLHRVQTLVDPQVRTDRTTMRDTDTMARGKNYPNNEDNSHQWPYDSPPGSAHGCHCFG